MEQNIDVNVVIRKLQDRVGSLYVENAILQARLEQNDNVNKQIVDSPEESPENVG